MEFKQYRRKGYSEMRPVSAEETALTLQYAGVSISEADLIAGSPKLGDMIARNPLNHLDQWLVAKKYFEDNLELVDSEDSFAEVFDRLVEELEKDKDNPSSYYNVWKANIAMAFQDEAEQTSFKDWTLHGVSNRAADRFLELLIRTSNT